ncbi:MAG: tRNA 2-thiouridine(34) synthase MnmA [Patescibacteria group bacterium]|nr:tRNA 2-thiouridine(34) synthase MnmA [Patescibacteria group bacterium]MDE1943890.1 tRNA 2-thiouridine(34) synthase MnmA [Patescibacteria group bacterium]MDE1945181.1 tRNA 2-thiouridine(34) synthase MnmA [Patescibacteria group bacterium]MDE2057426.1 tRNA 2-thiouridine(34) synthase MnmA [Patescibacteria group bacterium]
MRSVPEARGERVFVGLSGGVDSAVAAALLRDAGAKVTGVFIKGWYPPGLPCTWASDRQDAMRVAAHLAIPFATLDASAEYKRGVIDYLIAEYKAGRTPNPDVMCNREVKFGAFYRYAREAGADHIATGHYVSGEKDQRYFLWAVPREAFAFTFFPLADRTKPEVRALAKRYGLPVFDKPDSQGVCFLGPVSIEEFLAAELGVEAGEAVDERGERVGAHRGAALYTIGERVGLAGGPWYVREKDLAANRLVVGRTDALREGRTFTPDVKVRLSQANWLEEPVGELVAQYRYRGPRVRGRIVGEHFEPTEPFPEPPAPGQSLVCYRGDELLGGGIIEP